MDGGDADDRVYVTAPLLRVLCELADDADPRRLSVKLTTTPAADLLAGHAVHGEDDEDDEDGDGRTGGESLGGGAGDGDAPALTPLADVPPDAPVYSDFFLPDAGASIRRVFGVDLATPVSRSNGRFVTHPDADPGLSVTDDLAARVLVAVPPWTPGDVRAYGRDGKRRRLVLVDASAPEELL